MHIVDGIAYTEDSAPVLRVKGMRPLEEPNMETIAAMKEGDEIIAAGKSRFSSAKEMFMELGI